MSNSQKNINSLLLSHFIHGQGAAGYLRGRIPGLSELVARFFVSRSDIDRIQKAQELSEYILALTDFADMIPLRSEVATLEIRRLIAYTKQTDHTAHTVYLFLMGVWVYDNLTDIRDSINKSIASSKPVKMFIFQWIFASLLHDVGYLFYNFEKKHNTDSWQVFDEMFTLPFIQRFSGSLGEDAQNELKQIWQTFLEKYNIKSPMDLNNSEELIEVLNDIPWLADLIPGFESGLKAMASSTIEGPTLNEFAFNMARKGYDGTPVVDHGVASGLMLLKYTSVWYWLSTFSASAHTQLHREMNGQYGYFAEVLIKHVMPACRAVSYHNIHGIQFQLDKEPLLFLAVLCDELQIWDRFLSGEEHINNWKSIKHCMAEDLLTEVIYNDIGAPVLHIMTSNIHHKKLENNLEKRVVDWRNFVLLSTIE